MPIHSKRCEMTPRQAQRNYARQIRKWGQDVLMKWVETTGATASPVFGNSSGGTSSPKSKTMKGDVHMIQASQFIRQFTEIEVGDAILSIPFEFYRIADRGTTSFAVGDIIDEFAYAKENEGQSSPATGSKTRLDDLDQLHFEFGGREWTQKTTGDKLSAIWDALVGGVQFTNVILLTSV